MSALPTALYSAAQLRELDALAAAQLEIEPLELMQRAGAAAWSAARAHWPQARSIAVLCGPGSNGGDGYVIARLARRDGCRVRVFALAPPDTLRGAAAAAAAAAREAGVEVLSFTPAGLAGADLIVDALFGTGLARPLEGAARVAIDAVNAANVPVLAVDVPSGLCADTGAVRGAAVQAQLTVSFIALKPGLFTGAGRQCAGRIEYRDLGTPHALFDAMAPAARRVDLALAAALLPPRARHAHKGDCGHVLVLGGDLGYAGAPRLCGEAALRCGAGLVTIATRAELAPQLTAARPELMARGVDGALELRPLCARASVLALGPGLGRSDWSRRLFAAATESRLPRVLDADALNLLAEDPQHDSNWILTPHAGEAARLLGIETAAVQADRLAAAAGIAERYGGVTVLKGSGTVIATGVDLPAICSDGNPGMASAGMGDVLTGVIAALLAQGLAPADAARLGVCLHAAAGDRAAAEGGERGLLASDLMPWLRRLVNPAA